MQLNSVALDEIALRKQTLNIGQPCTEGQAMAIAVQLGWQGLGKTSPNPMVGAVALNEYGCLLGIGYHAEIGGPHAEVAMWDNIQMHAPGLRDLRGSKVFVSLEPCAHHGRTPPCADFLVRLQPRSVTYLMNDPNPKVAGAGAQRMRDAGIGVECLNDPGQIGQIQNEIFLWRQKNPGRIFVGMKVATSLGGAIASKGDQRRWLTGDRARKFGHFLRLRYDAIAVGANTLILDNPMLDPVGFGDLSRTPFKLVIDTQLRAAKYFLNDGQLPNIAKSDPAKVIWFCYEEFTAHPAAKWLEAAGCNVIKLDGSGPCSADKIMAGLRDFPIHSLLLEGGAGLYGAFFDSRKVQKLHEFIAPKFIGSSDSSIAIEAGRKTTDELVLSDSRLTVLGQDLLIESWFEN